MALNVISNRPLFVHEGTVHVCAHNVSFWYRGPAPITEELKERLNNEAEERARECINEECVQGELHYMTPDNKEIQYSGWWKIER